MTTWYPMETAPRDGTPILVWNEDKGVIYFSNENEEAEYDYSCVMLVEWTDSGGGYLLKDAAKYRPGPWVWAVPGSEQDEQGGYHTADNPKGWMHVPEWTGVE